MKLFELFETSYETKLVKNTPDSVRFNFKSANGFDYTVLFIRSDPGPNEGEWIWEFQFSQLGPSGLNRPGKLDITGTGDEIRIFSTILNIFLKVSDLRRDIEIVAFSAKEPTRKRLYDKLSKLFVSRAGWSRHETEESEFYHEYYLYRN